MTKVSLRVVNLFSTFIYITDLREILTTELKTFVTEIHAICINTVTMVAF